MTKISEKSCYSLNGRLAFVDSYNSPSNGDPLMRIGFSTGAIARGNYRSALESLRRLQVQVVELSALRMSELAPLVHDLPHLDLSCFSYVSFHAPSAFEPSEEGSVVEALRFVADNEIPVVVHPDTISDFALWREFGGLLVVENMDNRKAIGRTSSELTKIFEQLPNAGFC
ncbi:MAG TPA: hypothetical protein VHA14_01660, partial [Bryobacteraceae bacterium]|nr:hypothetical protein [Bryobacteraceae bacterium]